MLFAENRAAAQKLLRTTATAPLTWDAWSLPHCSKYKDGFPVEAACFPGDAMVTLMDPVTGAPTRLVTMGELAIGDVIECLKPAGFESRVIVDYRDSAQTYVRGACHVFNYHDADAVSDKEAAVFGGKVQGALVEAMVQLGNQYDAVLPHGRLQPAALKASNTACGLPGVQAGPRWPCRVIAPWIP